MEIVAALKRRFPDWAMQLTSCAGKRAAPGLDKEVPTLPCTVRLGRGRTQACVIIRTDSQRNVRGQQWLARSQVPVELLIERGGSGFRQAQSQERARRCEVVVTPPFPKETGVPCERDRRFESILLQWRVHANPLLHLFGYRLIVRGLKWSRIDLRQKVARLDILALAESVAPAM